MNRFLEFLLDNGLRAERLSTGTFLVRPGRVKYNAHSGRIKVKGRKTHPVRGLAALAHILVREARDPEVGHLYPPALRTLDVASLVAGLDDPLERRWAMSIARQAMAFA